MTRIVLYHGTSEASAVALVANGWEPMSAPMGSQCGDNRYLYLTDEPADALWYANEKGSDAILAVEVPVEDLIVDPEDGIADTVEAELASKWPAKLAARRAIPAESVTRWEPHPGFTI